MFNFLRDMLCPADPLTTTWLEKNATPYKRAAFELDAKTQGVVPIFHVTDLSSAQAIYLSKTMFGIDVVSAAHFHHTPQGAGAQAIADGVLLGFTWKGRIVNVDLSDDRSSHKDRRANILFDVPISEYRRDTWELRLYPGTSSGLKLEFIEYAQCGFLLSNQREVSIVHAE
ncbi:hypothetical protein [Paraburkholderia unamae]|uniref:Uncharacterized protein n=1 Tax=Paraburkholderia unamae TaxID=219649 RepID=A0ABX5KN06_9BURK|nr:hypothetical protein [Paraburkholderia unamae]PVX83670.1 hypothetical protein C7402_10674 [Paraburkholderia unamae]RAR63816.1 hypothetical protein C7401_10573 [Paraburkholderia unamae]